MVQDIIGSLDMFFCDKYKARTKLSIYVALTDTERANATNDGYPRDTQGSQGMLNKISAHL